MPFASSVFFSRRAILLLSLTLSCLRKSAASPRDRSALNRTGSRSTNTKSIGPNASTKKCERYPRPAPSSAYTGFGFLREGLFLRFESFFRFSVPVSASTFSSSSPSPSPSTSPASTMCATMLACCAACFGSNGDGVGPFLLAAKTWASRSARVAVAHRSLFFVSGTGKKATTPQSAHASRTRFASARSWSPRGGRDATATAAAAAQRSPTFTSLTKYGTCWRAVWCALAGHLFRCFTRPAAGTLVLQNSHRRRFGPFNWWLPH